MTSHKNYTPARSSYMRNLNKAPPPHGQQRPISRPAARRMARRLALAHGDDAADAAAAADDDDGTQQSSQLERRTHPPLRACLREQVHRSTN